jgi:hypothetical protein
MRFPFLPCDFLYPDNLCPSLLILLSDIEAKVNHVAFLHDVLFAF